MYTAYWHKPDFSVVMCLSRQVDSLSIAPAQDNANICSMAPKQSNRAKIEFKQDYSPRIGSQPILI